MVELFLSEVEVDDTNLHVDAVRKRILLLERVEEIIWSLLSSSGRYEARLWLCNTISKINSITPSDQRDLFIELLRYKRSNRYVAEQIVRMVFEKRSEEIGHVIAKRSNMLEKFFEGNPKRVLQWFDHFGSTSESGHRKGARALSQFAFINRDVCWDELVWKGKHGQSPAVVATKPHYFHDLDVRSTIENFLENVPDFWSSDELASAVKGGEILQIDSQFFVNQFIHLMYEEDLEDIWTILYKFLMEETFCSISQQVLVLLDEQELYSFFQSLSKLIRKTLLNEYPSSYIEILMSSQNGQITLNELLLLNTVSSHGRQLLHLMCDEEHKEEHRMITEILRSDSSITSVVHWSLLKECRKMKLHVAMKFVGLESWILYYILSKECKTTESCELLLSRSGIKFKKSSDYSLIQFNEFSVDTNSDDENCNFGRKGKRRRKRRKKSTCPETNTDALHELGISHDQKDLSLVGGSWLLSTDSYSCSWNTADLPEHLAANCFSSWMRNTGSLELLEVHDEGMKCIERLIPRGLPDSLPPLEINLSFLEGLTLSLT